MFLQSLENSQVEEGNLISVLIIGKVVYTDTGDCLQSSLRKWLRCGEKRQFLGQCLNCMVHVVIHSAFTAVWFCVSFLCHSQEYFQIFHSDTTLRVKDKWPWDTQFHETTCWRALKDTSCLQPARVAVYHLQTVGPKGKACCRNFYLALLPCLPPFAIPLGLWKCSVIRQLTEVSQEKFAQALLPIFKGEVIDQSIWASWCFTGMHGLHELEVHGTTGCVPLDILQLFFISLILPSKKLCGIITVYPVSWVSQVSHTFVKSLKFAYSYLILIVFKKGHKLFNFVTGNKTLKTWSSNQEAKRNKKGKHNSSLKL